jgi:branched-chain amino acid transport system permease protein
VPTPPSHPRHLLTPLRANFWLPLVLLALWPAAWWLEGATPFLGLTIDAFWSRIIIILGINLTLAVSLQLINGVAGQFSLGHAGFMAVGAYLGGYAVTAHGGKLDPDENTLDWVHPGGVLLQILTLLTLVVGVGAAMIATFRLFRLTRLLHRSLPTLLGWTLILWIVADVVFRPGDREHILGAVHGISALARTISETYLWALAAGAGAADFFTSIIPADWRKPACLVLSMIGGGLGAAVAGFVVGLPTLRLRGDYLAIATLGFAELIRVALVNSGPLGRATGLSVPTYALDAEPGIPANLILPWVYGAAILATLAVWRIQHSPKGRALQCLREDEIAAGAVGIDVTQHKVLAFVIGAFFAGVAGSLFAHFDGYINPQQFTMQRSIELVVIVTLGGLGSIPGTIIACILLTLFQPLLQTSGQWLPGGAGSWTSRLAELANQYRLVLFALLLIIVMIIRSRGWLDALAFWKRTPPNTPPTPNNPTTPQKLGRAG